MSCWQPITKLMAHQQAAVAKLLPSKVGALFMEMGTGKTRTAIEFAHLRQNKIDRVVWFCPVSVKHTIERELYKHTNCNKQQILVFDDKTRISTHKLRSAFWLIVGIESMSSSQRVVSAIHAVMDNRTMVVLDEATYIKGPRSLRSRRIELVSRDTRYRMILTGTPMTQGVQDLYMPMAFLSKKILGYNSFYTFANAHLEYEQVRVDGKKITTDRIISSHDTDLLARKMAPYCYQVKKEECLDLPPKIFTSFSGYMTGDQQEQYALAKERFAERVMDMDILEMRKPLLKLFTELQTIVCGFVTVDGKTTTMPHRRLDLLDEILGQVDGPVVIWGKYHHCIDEITDMLAQRDGASSVHQYHGLLSEKARARSLQQWADQGRYLVATQAAGGHGLNELLCASNVVFYANGFKYSERLQAEDRTHRLGQTKNCWYADIYLQESIDTRINNALLAKENALQDFMREMHQLRNDGIKESVLKMVQAL